MYIEGTFARLPWIGCICDFLLPSWLLPLLLLSIVAPSIALLVCLAYAEIGMGWALGWDGMIWECVCVCPRA